MTKMFDDALAMLHEAARRNRPPIAWEMSDEAFTELKSQAGTGTPYEVHPERLMGVPIEIRRDIAGWCLRTN